jgi:hypothetical protein
MGGGLMQLVAYGAQDIYLTGNPQITFFKVVYRRHTNFSMESIEQTWNGDPTTGRATATISRNGDLVYRLYLQQTVTVCTPPPKVANRSFDGDGSCCSSGGCCNSDYGPVVYNPGHLVIRHVEVEIGGQRIDHQTGAWMEVWAQLTQENSAAVLGVVGDNSGTKFQNMARGGGCVVLSSQTGKHSVSEPVSWAGREGDMPNPANRNQARFTKYDAYVPLQFWFCRNPGLALPLIALQYHEVRIILQINTDFVCGPQYNGSNCQPSACIQDNSLYADYIYLDTDERRRFAQVSHEYLIEQVQHQNFRSNGGSLDLNFNHPVKELIWTGGQSSVTGLFGILPGASADYLMPDFYADCETPGFNATYQLKLNGHDRMSLRPLEYFTKQQVYDYHTGTPVGCGDSYTTQCGQCCMGNLDFLRDELSVNAPPNQGNGPIGSNSNRPMSKDQENKNAHWSIPHQESFPQAYYAVGPGQAATAAIAVYSFALKPEEHQPSGTCNFSRIDNAQLVINGYPSQGKSGPGCCCDNYDVYAVNYNVLRIMSGMGGLAYSN